MPPLKRAWNGLLELGFGLLCVRFLIALFHETNGLLALPCLAGFLLAAWRPAAALFALALGFCLLSGLEQTVFLFPVALPVATAVWLGFYLRKIRPVPAAAPPGPAAAPLSRRAGIFIDVFAGVVLLHVVLLTLGVRSDPHAFDFVWTQVGYGSGSPLASLNLAFLWLHGLFYFRAIREYPESEIFSARGIRLVFLVNTLVFLLFFSVQWRWQFPYRWTPGYQSPFQDIGAFGAVAASLLIFSAAQLRRRGGWRTAALIVGTGFLALAVAGSWSRGTWLASVVFIGLLGVIRLPLRWTLLLAGSLVGTVIFLNVTTRSVSREESPFLARLITLVRFESPQAKAEESGRGGLPYKAWGMIREHPLIGHGPGSFFEKAPRYARAGDPWGAIPARPHNILLHLATEAGVPIALMFAGLMAALVWKGVGPCLPCFHRGQPGEPSSTPDRLSLALALTLGVYLQTNLTWDILLIHSPQFLFFWFLVAALIATLEREAHRTGSTHPAD